MDNTNRFTLMIDALTELAKEEQVNHASHKPETGLPTLSTILADITPLPDEALFLGLAEDGLPVLLNLHDPIPGPILIVGDQACGKTALLQTIARAVELLHSPSDVQYCIVTSYPNEWGNFQDRESNIGIYTTQDNGAQELIQSLVEWAHKNKDDDRTFLLLLDDLEFLTKLDQQTEQSLRWLLLRGTSRRIWPIVTLNASRAQNIETWLGFFRTRLFGNIQNLQDTHLVANASNEILSTLAAGSQFAMREGQNWLKFLSPAID